MRNAVLLVLLVAVCYSHLCLYRPTMKPDNSSILSETEYNDPLAPSLDKCKRNVNIGYFGNSGSSNFGSVCGGNARHPLNRPGPGTTANPWNDPITPIPSGNTFRKGTAQLIQAYVNRHHPASDGNREGFIILSYSTIANPTKQSDFYTIGIISAGTTNGFRASYTWNIPNDLSFSHGVLQAIYVTATIDVASNPVLGGVSNTYTSCADISIA